MFDNNKHCADYLLDRSSLKTKIAFWRNIALVVITFLVIQTVSRNIIQDDLGNEYVARIKITGDIFENSKRDKVIRALTSNPKVKAVVMHVDSLGGGLYSGENLYHLIKKLSKKKPVVTVMESYATSAAYMISMASNQIIARKSSVTGSIGAWTMVPDFTKLAEKLGVKMEMIKSGSLKAQPQPFSSMDKDVKKHTQESVDEAYSIFIDMVKKDRKLTEEAINKISSGATFMGQKALELGLIDQIGAEDEALEYLRAKWNISKDLQIRDVNLKKRRSKFEEITEMFDSVHQSFYRLKSVITTF